MSESGVALIWCPFANEAEAIAAAEQLVGEGLVACGNILPAIVSVFRWQGEVQRAGEVAALFKTTGNRLDEACARLAELHEYDTPAVLGWLVDSAPPATREWLAALDTAGG